MYVQSDRRELHVFEAAHAPLVMVLGREVNDIRCYFSSHGAEGG